MSFSSYGSGNLLSTGGTNIIIGYDDDVDANSRAACVIIGSSLSLNTASDNVVEIGNDTNSMTYDLDGGDITVTSDIRTKTNINDTELGFPVSYKNFQQIAEIEFENRLQNSRVSFESNPLIREEIKGFYYFTVITS